MCGKLVEGVRDDGQTCLDLKVREEEEDMLIYKIDKFQRNLWFLFC